jgi:hypothetical protein
MTKFLLSLLVALAVFALPAKADGPYLMHGEFVLQQVYATPPPPTNRVCVDNNGNWYYVTQIHVSGWRNKCRTRTAADEAAGTCYYTEAWFNVPTSTAYCTAIWYENPDGNGWVEHTALHSFNYVGGSYPTSNSSSCW